MGTPALRRVVAGSTSDYLERARFHAGRAEELLEEREGSAMDHPAARATFTTAHGELANFYLAEAFLHNYR